MTPIEMKHTYTQLRQKERSLNKQVNDYQFLINALLVELKGLGEKLDVSYTKEMLLRFEREKSKLESELVSVKYDKNVLSAKINNIFSRMLESNIVEEIFSSLNEKYESFAIPVEFDYEYDNETDGVRNVTFYKASNRAI
ncbi:hypothetical protein [Paenibacillus sp. LjRoot56]|uniref:hypothetical protein n=1 Tax=Paenibacillus sp. LjRoot56 TaxID=3342333 RepID=UPI003ED0DDDF